MKVSEEILALEVCDPACGSGSFLVASLRFLTDALYESLHRHGRIRKDGGRSLVGILEGCADGAALAEIVARFGPSVLRADGGLDRARLRELIFSDAAAKHDLEAITHPRIRLMLRAQCLEAPGPYVVVAIPLLAESGSVAAYPWLQRILVVDTPIALQRARLVLRDGIDAGLAERMISAQASREQRLALATDVLVNDGALADLEAPVRRLDALYRQLASRNSPL